MDADGEIVLRLSRRFQAPLEEVFDAWTNPAVLRLWWAASPTWESPHAEVDLRPGGSYRLSMRDTETGAVHTVFGEYTEVLRPDRLAEGWQACLDNLGRRVFGHEVLKEAGER